MRKKKIILIIVFSMMITLVGMVFNSFSLVAQDESLTFESYDNLIQEGILGDDVSYEEWVEFMSYKPLEDDPADDSFGLMAAWTMREGDMIITNGTSSKGIAGHAAIAVSSKNILHIAGPGKKVEVISLTTFKNRYLKNSSSWIKVYRHPSENMAWKASQWAIKNYKDKDYEYKITGNKKVKDPTYCSKIVWQAYYNSGAKSKLNINASGVVAPYLLPDYFNKENFKLVQTLKK